MSLESFLDLSDGIDQADLADTVAEQSGPTRELVADTEVMPNYSILGAQDVATGEQFEIELPKDGLDAAGAARLDALLGGGATSYWFNWSGYDQLIIRAWRAGFSVAEVYEVSRAVFDSGKRSYAIARDFNLPNLPYQTIDLMLYTLRGGLKKHAARMGRDVLELPVDPTVAIDAAGIEPLKRYLFEGDLPATRALLDELRGEIDVRQTLERVTGVGGLMGKTAASAAEAVVIGLYCNATGVEPRSIRDSAAANRDLPFRFELQPWLRQAIAGTRAQTLGERMHGTTIDPSGGKFKARGDWPGEIAIDPHTGLAVTIGFGGLHSCDSAGDFAASIGIDVASMYPSLLLRPGGAPTHLNEAEFHSVYRGLVERRLAAKRAGNKLESTALKLVLNSVYGQLGQLFSALYSPRAQLRCTASGQLLLVALCDRLRG